MFEEREELLVTEKKREQKERDTGGQSFCDWY